MASQAPAARLAIVGIKSAPAQDDAQTIRDLLSEARTQGDAGRGAEVFGSARYACATCHRVGSHGGSVGPDLSTIGATVKPEDIAESVLWPRRKVKDGYMVQAVATKDGRIRQGYVVSFGDAGLELRDTSSDTITKLEQDDIEEINEQGSLMPDGLAQSMTERERVDVMRFLLEMGGAESARLAELVGRMHEPAAFAFGRAPLSPADWPSWTLPVNRERVYDFYAKEADYFAAMSPPPRLLPEFPGLDGGAHGHWGNQNEDSWADDRWNRTELGTVLCGVFRGASLTVPKGVCVRLGEEGELSACFNPETLCYEAVWEGGFLRFSPVRHGLMNGLIPDGTPHSRPEGRAPTEPFVYRGFYRHGKRVVFAYRIGETEYLDAPWVDKGQFVRVVGPRESHPALELTRGRGPQWPLELTTHVTLGSGRPYAIDSIEPPFENPSHSLMFFGGHDFLPDGSALLATIQGEVWRVTGLDASSTQAHWRRFASGLHQALGLVVAGGQAYVVGRDQITRLHDLDGDGEADFYENFSNVYDTSPGGHDFIMGLQRDREGRFYTASSVQGLLRISADGRAVETIATGFRNPDGLGLAPDGTITVPCSEGEWTPASMICEIRPGAHYGYLGPKPPESRPDLPLVYLPRGVDNSSAEQVFVDDPRFGPLAGHFVHLSYGAGTACLVLRDRVADQPQGAVVTLPWEFQSGVHRGRVRPQDGCLYVSGMAGWGTYTPADGCFQRVRYTGDPVRIPIGWRAHENGIILEFSQPLPGAKSGQAIRTFVQAWNYRYGPGYGSAELSTTHPGMPGHDVLTVQSLSLSAQRDRLFLEIPDLQPVNQLHIRIHVGNDPGIDVFGTVHRLAPPYDQFPGYRRVEKTIAAHPMEADLVTLRNPPPPNPWRERKPLARRITIEAGKNLNYTPRVVRVKAGEHLQLTLLNPDAVPHNWALIRPGQLLAVGELLNKIIAEPDAAFRQYIPRSDDVLVYTDIVNPHSETTIYFQAPDEPGTYPFLCTFPGHWMAMNGELIVE
jgi:putative heme-binding domain-containing protein